MITLAKVCATKNMYGDIMINNTVSVVVPNLTPSQIIDFLMKLDNETYQKWHKDHVQYRLISWDTKIVNTKLFLEEKQEGKFHIGYEFKIIEYEPDARIVYKQNTRFLFISSLRLKQDSMRPR